MRNKEFPIALIVPFIAPLFMFPAQADDLVADEGLQSAMMTQLDLAVCADTALTFTQDEALAERYSDLSDRMFNEAVEAGWTTNDTATAAYLVIENRTDIIVHEDDTLEDYRLRNYTGERCERQEAAAREYLAGSFPRP